MNVGRKGGVTYFVSRPRRLGPVISEHLSEGKALSLDTMLDEAACLVAVRLHWQVMIQ